LVVQINLLLSPRKSLHERDATKIPKDSEISVASLAEPFSGDGAETNVGKRSCGRNHLDTRNQEEEIDSMQNRDAR